MRFTTCTAVGALCALALLPATAGALTLDESLALAARSRPEIAGAAEEAAAGEGRLSLAPLHPVPELDLETRSDLGESSLGVSILQERGGKREARVAAARAGLDLIGAQARLRRLEAGHAVRSAHLAVLAADRSLALREEAIAIARSFAETVAEKVRAGAASPIEETRAAVRLHGAAAEVERARREAARARADLALAVGDPEVRTAAIEGALPEGTAVPELAALVAQAAGTPDLEVPERELRLRRSALVQERAAGAPDIGWRAAVSHNRLDDEAWVSIGVTIPLPAPGRNRGALAAAAAEVARADRELAAAGRRVAAGLARAHAELQAAAREAAILRDDVLAGAERALATVQEGYRLGKFPYLDVLDAAEALLDARLQHAAALAGLAQAKLDVDRLLGDTDLPATPALR